MKIHNAEVTGSFILNGVDLSNLTGSASDSGSFSTQIVNLNQVSSSLNSFTSSINTTIKSKLDSESVISGSIQVSVTGTTGYSTFSSSVSSSIGDLSGSVATTTSGLSSSIGSLSSSIATTTSGLSSSVATTTIGLGGRLSSIEGVSGSYATTGSNQFKNDQVITGSLIVTGFIETQELRTTYISSSILFRSGSTKFGDELDDTHAFTGSLLVSGSISVPGSNLVSGSSQVLNGSGVFSGSAQLPSGIVSSSAQTIENLPSGTVSGSGQVISLLPSGTVSGSVQVDVMSTTNIARLATTGSNTFTSNQTIGTVSTPTSGGNLLSVFGANSATNMQVFTTTNHATFFEANTNSGSIVTRLQSQSASFVGTLTNNSFDIVSNGTTVIRTTGDGNVTLGTTSTGADGLSLNSGKNLSFAEGSGLSYVNIFRQLNSAALVMGAGYKRSLTGGFASSFSSGMARAAIAIGYNNGSIAFFSDPSSTVANGTDIGITEKMTLTNNGNLGVGTISPNTKLEIKGSVRLDSRSKAEAGEIDSITFTKDRPDASTGTYEMGAIRSFTYGGYAGGLTFYSGRHTGGGSYGLIPVMTIGSTNDIGLAHVGIGTTSPISQLSILHPSYIGLNTIQGVIRIIGQSNTENSGTTPSAGTALEFYNKWTGGDEYSVGRISGRAAQGYAGGLQFDVAPPQGPGQNNFITAISILRNGYVTTPLIPAFKAGRSTSIGVGANSTIVFNDTSGNHFNNGGHYNTSNGIFTAPVAGKYVFSAVVIYQEMSAGQAMDDAFYIYKNSDLVAYSFRRAEYEVGFTGNGGYYVDHANILLDMAAGHTASIRNNRALTLHGNTNYAYFYGYLVG